MSVASIDPSLAIGFYCKTFEDYEDLMWRLQQLEHDSGASPVLCVRSADDAMWTAKPADETAAKQQPTVDGWELL